MKVLKTQKTLLTFRLKPRHLFKLRYPDILFAPGKQHAVSRTFLFPDMSLRSSALSAPAVEALASLSLCRSSPSTVLAITAEEPEI
ncbi:hypothetical protein C8R47DRAFT_1212227 [Mycena vitilis]|nr:hypothetical protein C8R47DRAFT_1212227 [Mycena vitilis]